MNLNKGQILALVIATLGVLVASTSQLNDLFGPAVTKYIISAAALFGSVLSTWMAILFGQGSLVQQVQSMPGVSSIVINSKANSTLAALAVDPGQAKVDIAPGSENAVKATAAAA